MNLSENKITYDIGPTRKIPKPNYLFIFAISILLVIIILFIGHNIEANKTCEKEDVIFIKNPNKNNVQENMIQKCPMIVNKLIYKDDLLYELKPEELADGNPEYMIKWTDKIYPMKEFVKRRIGYLYNDPLFITDFKMDFRINRLAYGFINNLSCSKKSYFNMFLNKMKLNPEYSKNNISLIMQLNGKQTINLFHPRYKKRIFNMKSEIWNKNNNQISDTLVGEKYLELNLDAGQILYIPKGWTWCSMVSDSCVYVKYVCDTYFTTIVNKF